MEYFLKQIDPGNLSPLQISLNEDEMVIGRSTVILMSRYNRVSRRHASFTKENDSWFITDLKSLNCLYVNFERIQHTVKLNVGDVIGFGSPNVAQDGGFVCVLAVQNKVIMKVEPSDEECVEIEITEKLEPLSDEECVEIPIEITEKLEPLSDDDCVEIPTLVTEKMEPLSDDDCVEIPTVVTEKVEPLSDDDCVEISNNYNNINIPSRNSSCNINEPNIAECIPSQHTFNETYESKISIIDATTKNLRSMSSEQPDLKTIKTESCDDLHLSVNVQPKVQAYSVQPTSNCLESNTQKGVNNIESVTVSIPCKLIHANHVSKSSGITNTRVEWGNAIGGSMSMGHNHAQNPVQPIRPNIQSTRVPTYPGIVHVGLEKLGSCGIISSNATSINTDLEKLGNSNTSVLSNSSHVQSLNTKMSSKIKQGHPKEVITDLGDNIKVKNENFQCVSDTPKNCVKLIHPTTFQKCENVNELDVKQSIAMNEHLPKDCTRSIFETDNINLPNNLGTSKKNCDLIPNISSQSSRTLFTDSFCDKTRKIHNSTENILSLHKHCNLTKNVKDEGYSKENTERTSFLTKKIIHHTLKQKHDIFQIDKEVNPTTPPSQLKTATLSILKIHKSDDFQPKITQDCSTQVEYHSKNAQTSLNAAESSPNICTTKKYYFNEKPSKLARANNAIEECSASKNTTSQAKINNVTVEINLKVRKNKILSSDSEGENEMDFPSPKPSFPKRRPRQNNKKQHKNNSKLKRSKAKKSKTEVSNNPIAPSVIRSKRRRYSWSDYSDDYYRSRSPSTNENDLQVNKSKSFGKTLLIDFKPMEYRPRKLRGREEWFQERNSGTDVKTSKPRLESLNEKKSFKTVDSVIEYSRKRKIKVCQERKERESRCHVKETYKNPSDSTDKNTNPKKSVNDSVIRKRTIPPVPRRTNNFCSRMGFLIDTQGKCDIQSINKGKNREKLGKKNQISSTYREIMPSKSKLQLDLSLELELPPNKQTTTQKINSVKNKFPKTSTEAEQSVMKLQRQVSNYKDNPQVSTNNEHKYDKSIQMLELDSNRKYTVQSNTCEESSWSDNILDSNILKTTTKEGFQSKEPPNSKKRAIVSPSHEISKNSPTCRRSERLIKKLKKSSLIPTNKNDSKRVPILELDSKRKYDVQSSTCEESNLSDHFSDSNTKITRKSFQSRDSPNSKEETILSPNHQIANDTKKSRRSAKIIQDFQTSSALLMEMIVSWNPKWLVEQKKIKNPPPLIAKGASCLNLSFSSYESYASSYFPMIVLEVWECLFRECSQHLVSEQLENCNNFCYSIKSWEDRHGWTELKCVSIVSDTLGYHPTEGKVVLLNIKERQEHGLENYTFGCIRSHSMEVFQRGAPEWEIIPKEALNNAKLVKFEVIVKKSKRPYQLNSVYLAHGLPNIKQKLQMADALRYFRYSPLRESIYHPREETLMFCDSSRPTLSWNNLNHALCEEVQNPISNARVLMLQTPPGTGKTKCVIELVKKLTTENSKFKVLVCAPSHSSLDEILCELVQSNENCRNSSSSDLMKLVRLDNNERISENLKEYSLTKKVENLYREDCVKKMHSRESALKLLEQKINDILFKQKTSQDMYSKINKSTTLKSLVDKVQNLKGKNLLHRMDEGFQSGYECIILRESAVLLSILDSSMLPAVTTFLKSGSAAYCIVVKAAQCNELQLLQCLHQKVEKLILFGDPQQQKPTAVSNCAAKYGFGRSIFERFYLHFKKKFHKTPCPAFKKQYRMHSEICWFPSKYFYNQELSTAEGTDEIYANFPLKPYTVIDVLEGPIPEETESSLIMYICSELVQACPTATVGVILAGEGQKHGISLPCEPEYAPIEIDTLEYFQGKEKDIILIACMPQENHEDSIISCREMLNVALTRAKQCLIVCGQVPSNEQHPHWRALKEDASARYCYLCVTSVKDIPLLFANYIKKAK